MKHKSEFIENGYYYRHWAVSGETRAVILLVHGLGEHCARYQAVAESFNGAGYAVCSMDLPGHGKSVGRPGFVHRFSDFEHAVHDLYEKIAEWYPDLPVFLLGHSMGGLIATKVLIDHQDRFSGALLSGAAIQSPQQPPAFQIGIIKIISALLPKLGVLSLDASGISRDPKVVEDYMNDPLVAKGRLSARLLAEMFKTMETCKAEAKRIALPIRIMHGGSDDMTSPSGSEFLYQTVASKDKELKIYDGLMHEIFNEPEGDEITAEMIDWLASR